MYKDEALGKEATKGKLSLSPSLTQDLHNTHHTWEMTSLHLHLVPKSGTTPSRMKDIAGLQHCDRKMGLVKA